ncbi:MAG: MmcQ/YjbR family DNA-binding protein [Rhizobiales bacterium]|nr:MmcQ/YjbR family DNA-binding protein [Hyphomicrobiales bacterium]
MILDEYNSFCAGLAHTTHVVQWGNADVWKIGAKVFAIAGWLEGDELGVTFKVSELSFEILKEQPGCRPAPYLASRGMKWIQRTGTETLSDAELCDYLRQSYAIVGRGLTKKLQRELGLLD